MLLSIPSLLIIHLAVGTHFLLDNITRRSLWSHQEIFLHRAGVRDPMSCALWGSVHCLLVFLINKLVFSFLNPFSFSFSWGTSSSKNFQKCISKNAFIVLSFLWMVWLSIHPTMKIILSWNFKGIVPWSCIIELLKRSLQTAYFYIFYGVLASLGVLKFHNSMLGCMPLFHSSCSAFPGIVNENSHVFHSWKCYFYENFLGGGLLRG